MEAGGPRAGRARREPVSGLTEAGAGVSDCSTSAGRLGADAASACAGVEGPARKPGNMGQVIGAVRIGVLPEASWASIAAICMAMAQW